VLHGGEISDAERTPAAAISVVTVDGQDAAESTCREETKPVSLAITPVCRCGKAAILSVT